MANLVKENLKQIVTGITESYIDYPVSPEQFKCCLPNKLTVIDITDKLVELVFPGYFGEITPEVGTISYYIGDIILSIERKLHNQIALALSQQYCSRDELTHDLEDEINKKAEEITLNFFLTLPETRELVAGDVQAAFDGDPAATDKNLIISCYPGVFAIGVYRLANKLLQLGTPIIPRIMTEYAHSITGIEIHPGASIGKSFFIDHGTGVVIGETTIIGNNVKLYQGVTLGAKSTRGGQSLSGVKRHPTIEDNVTIYSGASVLGGDTVIGKNVVVSGNAFITKSVSKTEE